MFYPRKNEHWLSPFFAEVLIKRQRFQKRICFGTVQVHHTVWSIPYMVKSKVPIYGK